MPAPRPSVLRLLLWPTLLTFAVSCTRLVFEVQGSVTTRSGGALAPLGISWLAFVFGWWFARRLRRDGSMPLLRPAWIWAAVTMLGLVGAVVYGFSGVSRTEQGDAAYATLRASVQTIVVVALALAAFAFVVWPRLAWTLLLYAIPARLTVVLFTWIAKQAAWDTHYTKFGPAGIERPMDETMFAATVAQLGFWIPFTVVAGSLAGALTVARGGATKPSA